MKLGWNDVFSEDTSVELSVEKGWWRLEVLDATGEVLYWAYYGTTIWEALEWVSMMYTRGLVITPRPDESGERML